MARTRDAQPAPPVTMNRNYRTTVPEIPASVGLVRGFPNLYEMQAETGAPVSVVPAGRWNRGTLYRSLTPVLSTPAPVFPHDPLQGGYGGWTRASA